MTLNQSAGSPAPAIDPAVRDRDSVRRALAGDPRAFAEIVRHYQGGLFNLACRMVRDRETARDLTQDIFIRVHRSLGKYDPTYPFSSWIYRVGTNLCIDWIRKKKIATVSLDAPVAGSDGDSMPRDVADTSQDPALNLERAERARLVNTALADLSENHRLMLVLRHQRDLSYQEIAQILEIPLGTVKARIHRARDAFRRILERDHDLEDLRR